MTILLGVGRGWQQLGVLRSAMDLVEPAAAVELPAVVRPPPPVLPAAVSEPPAKVQLPAVADWADWAVATQQPPEMVVELLGVPGMELATAMYPAAMLQLPATVLLPAVMDSVAAVQLPLEKVELLAAAGMELLDVMPPTAMSQKFAEG